LARKSVIACVVLTVLLALTVYAYMNVEALYEDLHQRYIELKEERDSLASQYNDLSQQYATLLEQLENLSESYSELREAYQQLLEKTNITAPAITAINDREYHIKALELINRANESIYIIMYAAKYDEDDPIDPANDLIRALAAAHERGVGVHVILDEEPRYNEDTMNYLVSEGINVTYDSGGVRTHCKLVVIDGYIVLIGSHNWTESALSYNHETSLLIKSEPLAELEIRYFNTIWAEATG